MIILKEDFTFHKNCKGTDACPYCESVCDVADKACHFRAMTFRTVQSEIGRLQVVINRYLFLLTEIIFESKEIRRRCASFFR